MGSLRDDAMQESVGGRVATLRKLQGLKQHQLADMAHLSVSLVKKVESGHAPASHSFAVACARALGVGVTRLTGQPYENLLTDPGADRAAIPLLRRALDAYDVPQVDGPVWSAATLRARLDECEALRRKCRYSELAERLPRLLHHSYALLEEAATGVAAETANALLDDAYNLVQAVAYKFGYLDLAALAADRLATVARRSGDSLRVAVAAFHRSDLQLHRGDYDLGIHALDKAQQLASEKYSPESLAVQAQLHLRQAVFAARIGHADDSDMHINAARDLVNRGVPAAPYFDVHANRLNVDIHSVAVSVELYDGTTALARAESLRFTETEEIERIGHHYVDMARAWLLHGDREHALQSLQSARRVAPQQTRYHPSVRETVHAIALAERRSNNTLAGFAQWAGVSL